VIESIAPKIRRLIEQEINDDLESELDFGEEESVDDVIDMSSDMGTGTYEFPEQLLVDDPIESSDDIEVEDDSEEDKNVTVNITVESRLDRRANQLRKAAVDLVLQLKETKSKTKKKKILSELRKIKSLLVRTNEADKKLGKEINEVLKESKMSNTTRRSARQNKDAWWLFEGDEDIDLGDDQGEETEELESAEEEADLDVAAIKSAVEDLASAIGLDVAGADADADADDDAEVEEDSAEDEEMELDLEMDEMDDMDETSYMDEMDDMDDMDEMDHMDEADEEDSEEEIVEISEAAIRREIRKMRRSSKKNSGARRRRISEMGDPVAAMHSGADEVLDISREDLINALADELGDADGEDLNIDGSGDAVKAADSFGGASTSRAIATESRKRRLARRTNRKSRVSETATKKALLEARKEVAAAKQELRESNLFNAKLLYVNKLMQQHDLNSKQQRAIVEALDNAKTHREAKLLYTSLTESLRRRSGSKNASTGKLSEGLVRGGSSSNPTKSAAPAKNGNGLDRWATLAGLKE
jgi:hypothetical protein